MPCTTDRPPQDRVDCLQGAGSHVVRSIVEPVVHVVGGQFLELLRADERDDVGLGEALVIVDRLGGHALGVLGEPAADGLLGRVTVARVDAGFEFGHGLLELVLDDLFGSPPALDALASALAVFAEVDGTDVPVVLRVDRALVLADDDLQRLPLFLDATRPVVSMAAQDVPRHPCLLLRKTATP